MSGLRLFRKDATPVKKPGVDMTQGSMIGHIFRFALPLLVGNLFQQMYNMVDTWVVGNYVSNEAYSAVGSVGPIINLLIGLFIGLSSGAGVVISQYYGARQYDQVSRAVHTALLTTLLLGVVFMGLGIAITPYMLDLMKMPPSVRPEATSYLTIYFSGIMGLMIYNIGSGILRAIGDSKRPFYYLVVCALMNTLLDLVFVLQLGMGVEGVAWATVISQCVSALLIVITLLCTGSCVKLTPKKLRIHWSVLKKILTIGIPAALQMAITSFSNVFVQSYINFFGEDCMSGWTTYAKVDQLLFLPMQSISLASTTFVGQNLGCKQVERAKKGVGMSLLMAVGLTLVAMVPVLIFAKPIVAFFNAKPEVVEYAVLLLQWLTPFYVLCCFNQIYAGALRGAGDSRTPMLVMLISFVVFRQVYLLAMSHICNEIIPIAMGYPAGWLLCSLLTTVYFYKVDLGKFRLVEDTEAKA